MLSNRELMNETYKTLWQSKELAKLLGNPKTPAERNEKIKRGLTPLSYATADRVNFITIYLSSTTETDNMYANRAFLNVNIYAKSYSELMQMSELIDNILQEKMDMFCTSMYDVPSDAKGVYIYTHKYRPLIWA